MSERRIAYALGHLRGTSVFAMPKEEWRALIHHSGEPTVLDDLPDDLAAVREQALYLGAAGSGEMNPTPGIDVVRHDPGDAPTVINIDHYTVIENLPDHDQYEKVLSTCGFPSDPNLGDTLRDYVFVCGPERSENHWCETIPEHIANARHRSASPPTGGSPPDLM